jgi:outer membrane protein
MRGLIRIKSIFQVVALLIAIMASAAVVAAEDRMYTLADAYHAALGTNESVKIAEEGVSQSDSRLDQAWSYVYPHLVGQAAYTKYNETLPPGGDSFIFQPKEQFQASLILTQPLYTGGRTLAGLRTAEKMQEASKSGLSVAKQEILLKVAEAYYGVLEARKSIETSRGSLERMERHKRVTEREASTRKTKSNTSALLRANTLVSQARINLVRAENGLRVSREKLTLLTKLPLDALLAEPPAQDQPADGLDRLKEAALIYRDDYAGAKLNQSIAAEYVMIVKGGHYPQLYAEAGVTYTDSRPATLLDATTYYGGLRLQIPFFEGGLMKAEVSDARSKQRQAELSTDALRQSIESEVHEAYVNLQTVTSVLETAKLQMGYARDNFAAVEGMFGEGLVASLSLIDAEQALSSSERELANATYDQQVAILRLRKSIGTLGAEERASQR